MVGNLEAWPSALQGVQGWDNFSERARNREAVDRPVLRARFETLSDGDHLLVGKDIGDLDGFAKRINTALALVLSLIFVLAGRPVFPSPAARWGESNPSMRPAGPLCKAALANAYVCMGRETNGINSRTISIRC